MNASISFKPNRGSIHASEYSRLRTEYFFIRIFKFGTVVSRDYLRILVQFPLTIQSVMKSIQSSVIKCSLRKILSSWRNRSICYTDDWFVKLAGFTNILETHHFPMPTTRGAYARVCYESHRLASEKISCHIGMRAQWQTGQTAIPRSIATYHRRTTILESRSHYIGECSCLANLHE